MERPTLLLCLPLTGKEEAGNFQNLLRLFSCFCVILYTEAATVGIPGQASVPPDRSTLRESWSRTPVVSGRAVRFLAAMGNTPVLWRFAGTGPQRGLIRQTAGRLAHRTVSSASPRPAFRKGDAEIFFYSATLRPAPAAGRGSSRFSLPGRPGLFPAK